MNAENNHSDTRPTVTPEAEPVRTIAEAAATPEDAERLVDAFCGVKSQPGDCVEKAAEEIWDCAFDAYCTHNGGTTAHESAHNAVAAILRKHFGSEADELRRRDEEIARLKLKAADRDQWQEVALNNQARAEKAEAELRAVAGELRGIASGVFTETVRAAREIANERDTIRAEVAALKAEVEEVRKEWNEREPQLMAAEQERDALKAELRSAQAEVERLKELGMDGVDREESTKKLLAATKHALELSNNAYAEMSLEALDWKSQYERERSERQKEVGMQEYRGNTVSYIYDKERGYGAHFDRMNKEIATLRAQLAASEQRLKEAEAMADLIRFRVLDWKKNGRGVAAFRRDRMEALSDALAKFDAARSTSSTGGAKP